MNKKNLYLCLPEDIDVRKVLSTLQEAECHCRQIYFKERLILQLFSREDVLFRIFPFGFDYERRDVSDCAREQAELIVQQKLSGSPRSFAHFKTMRKRERDLMDFGAEEWVYILKMLVLDAGADQVGCLYSSAELTQTSEMNFPAQLVPFDRLGKKDVLDLPENTWLLLNGI